ncbi:DUF3035 domain-containing protein [Litorivita pollutaquae]|uniref:DUF3035 domain-containing protein n=1 Tax=Litorivita pollutaquae TaxID=2200892 RepID=A0A2V4NC13_9RHOB|nr:DUF3035 domain-containing protein [Litorivita pollutaquae]PYC47713.1 DUF3035 domain-containing protein [Litorivita pollutaquae]
MRTARVTHIGIGLGLALLLSACGGGEGRDIKLRNLSNNSGGPNEFAVIPGKPLQAPADFAALPEPTPGAGNITDQNPKADAVAALGGNSARLTPAGVTASDTALTRHATRFGTQSNIRQTLAVEDEEYRRRKSRFTKLKIVKVDRYREAYKPMSLDPQAEMERFRRLGVDTPSAPPNN